MELGLFNVENGYLEATIRSLRLSMLKEDHYSQIKNLQDLIGLKQVRNKDYSLKQNRPMPIASYPRRVVH